MELRFRKYLEAIGPHPSATGIGGSNVGGSVKMPKIFVRSFPVGRRELIGKFLL